MLDNATKDYNLQKMNFTFLLIIRHAVISLSFAISARVIKEKARVVAMDLRGHGKSSTENEVDMSIEVHLSIFVAP